MWPAALSAAFHANLRDHCPRATEEPRAEVTALGYRILQWTAGTRPAARFHRGAIVNSDDHFNCDPPCSCGKHPGDDRFAADIAAARKGCPAAFDRLFAACRPHLWMAAAHSLPGELKAKVAPSDVVQETSIHAKANFPHFVGTTESELRAWLRGILKKNVQAVSRKFLGTAMRELGREVSQGADSNARHVPVDLGNCTPGSQLVADEETERLMAALDRLPNHYRQIIVLRSIDERPFAEIGQLLGCSEDAARKRWVRAIDRLRSELLGDSELGDAREP